MNRTIKAIIAIVLVGVITFSAIIVCQNIGRRLRLDVTERGLYTLSDGTKSILSRLHQPVKMKLYYTKTAAMKAPDQIRFFNDYYQFVNSLLLEYAQAAPDMVDFELIDPRPFSDEEADAIRHGLKRIPMGEEESFIFGLVVQTQFGVTKSIPLFSPDRQSFVEHDISYLIDTAIRRQKKTIGVMSSLSVMGDDVSGYMAQMMAMQGQKPAQPWAFVEQLREQYDVSKIDTDVEEINDVDILMVVHPKELPEKAQFAIDQFVLKGGRTILFVDPHCFADQPKEQQRQMYQPHDSSSNLDMLLEKWGLKMPAKKFAGDRSMALTAALAQGQRPQKIIGFLGVTPQGFNPDSVITADLNMVRMLFAGVLKQTDISDANDVQITRTPIVSTTARGNQWGVQSDYELMMPDATRLMKHFTDGTEPVHMGYMVTGRFNSAFPGGIEITDEDPNIPPRKVTGLQTATDDCAVAVFSDVDFISDMMAYQTSFFGKMPVADNAALVMNTIDDLSGSGDLISIRSRGNFRRPFAVVDEIEAEAEKGTAEEEQRINAEIAAFQSELNNIISSAKEGEEEVIGSSILQKRKEIELKIHEAQKRLRELKMQKLQQIEKLGANLRNLNTLPGPIVILLIAVVLGIIRTTKKRRYVSHASDS